MQLLYQIEKENKAMNRTVHYAKVTFVNSEDTIENKPNVEFIVIYATSFADAAQQIEAYYRNELLTFEIFATDNSLHMITEREYEAIKNESI